MTMDYNVYLVGSKGVTPADKKFIEKYMIPRFKDDVVNITNPFSGENADTNILIGTLVNCIQQLSACEFSPGILLHWNIPFGQATQLFDRARMLVLKLDSNIYSNFVD